MYTPSILPKNVWKVSSKISMEGRREKSISQNKKLYKCTYFSMEMLILIGKGRGEYSTYVYHMHIMYKESDVVWCGME